MSCKVCKPCKRSIMARFEHFAHFARFAFCSCRIGLFLVEETFNFKNCINFVLILFPVVPEAIQTSGFRFLYRFCFYCNYLQTLGRYNSYLLANMFLLFSGKLNFTKVSFLSAHNKMPILGFSCSNFSTLSK